MDKHLSCAAFKIKLTTGSCNVGTCEKLHDRSRIRIRQKAVVCASALKVSGSLCLIQGLRIRGSVPPTPQYASCCAGN